MKIKKKALGCLVVLTLSALAGWLTVLIGFRGPVLPPEPLPDNIVDLHVHCAGTGAGESGCFVAPAMRDSFKTRFYVNALGVSIEEIEEKGDAFVLQKISQRLAESETVRSAVVLALDGVVGPDGTLDLERTQVYIPNEFVARETQKYANLFFGASVNPERADALDRLARVKQQGAVLVKWLPSIQRFDPADPRFAPFYRGLAELGLPLLCHTGEEHSFTSADQSLGDPARLELALQQGVTVIAAHAATTGANGGEPNLKRLLRLMARYPNLYADISSLTQLNKVGHLEEVLRASETRGRLVYGSDFPLTATPLVSSYWFPLNLTRKQMSRMQGLNAWDRDVGIKQALGVPTDVFARTAQLLGLASGAQREP